MGAFDGVKEGIAVGGRVDGLSVEGGEVVEDNVVGKSVGVSVGGFVDDGEVGAIVVGAVVGAIVVGDNVVGKCVGVSVGGSVDGGEVGA